MLCACLAWKVELGAGAVLCAARFWKRGLILEPLLSHEECPADRCVPWGQASLNANAGLGRGGQQLQSCRKAYQKAVDVLATLANLQTAFYTLDEALKVMTQPEGELQSTGGCAWWRRLFFVMHDIVVVCVGWPRAFVFAHVCLRLAREQQCKEPWHVFNRHLFYKHPWEAVGRFIEYSLRLFFCWSHWWLLSTRDEPSLYVALLQTFQLAVLQGMPGVLEHCTFKFPSQFMARTHALTHAHVHAGNQQTRQCTGKRGEAKARKHYLVYQGTSAPRQQPWRLRFALCCTLRDVCL